MEKDTFYKPFYLVSVLTAISFIIITIIDYFRYDDSFSMPFYNIIIIRAIEFILPSIIFIFLGRFVKNKSNINK